MGAGGGGFGGGNGGGNGGGGGGALGGAVFVAAGGRLTLAGTTSETGGTVSAGAGGGGGTAGTAFDSGIFYEGGTAAAPATLTFGAGDQTIADAIGDLNGAAGNTTTANGFGSATGGVAALNKVGTGTLKLSAANTYTGGTALDGGTLALGQQSSAGTGAITFATNAAQTLRLDFVGALGASVAGFTTDGDAFDFATLAATATASYASGTLTVTDGTNTDAITTSAAPAGFEYAVSSDGTNHALVKLAAIPAPTISAPANGTDTNNPEPTISGTGESGDTVTLTASSSNGTTFIAGTTVANGVWSITPQGALPDGAYTATATETSPSGTGMSAPSNTETFTVDTTAPTITSITLDKSAYKLGDTVTATINLSANDGNGAYTLGTGSTIDGVTPTVVSYDSQANTLTASFVVDGNTPEVIQGAVPVNVTVDDAATNASTADTTAVPNETIDTHAPTAVSVAGFTNGGTDTGKAPAAAGSTVGALSTADASPNDSFTYALGGNDAGRFTISNGVLDVGGTALTDGTTYDLTVTSTDLGSNQYAQAVQVTGATTPTVTSIVPAGASPTNASSDPFTVTFSQAVTGVQASNFTLSGTGTGTIGTPTTTDGVTYTVPVTSVSGNGTLGLDLTSTTGIVSTSTATTLAGTHSSDADYTIDTTAPIASSPTLTVAQNAAATPIGIAAPSDNLTAANGLAIVAGALPSDGTVTLADDTTPVTGGEALTATQLTGLAFTPTPGAFDQGSTFTYSVTDGAGNASTGTAALDIGAAGAPTLAGTHASSTSAEAPVMPFTGVTLADPNRGTETLTITLENGGGTLAGAGLAANPDGSYTLAGSAATVTQDLDGLSFTPTAPPAGTSATTTFVLSDASSAGTSVTDAGTSVKDTAAAAPAPTPTPAPPTPTPDTISIDPNAAFIGHGTFVLTGEVSSPAGVKSVEISARVGGVDGVETDLGSATVNANGTFTFEDKVGAHVQGFITATETDDAGGTASDSPLTSLQAGIRGQSYQAMQDFYTPGGSMEAAAAFEQNDGHRTVVTESDGQTLTSQFHDTFANQAAADTTFVFNPGYWPRHDQEPSLRRPEPRHGRVAVGGLRQLRPGVARHAEHALGRSHPRQHERRHAAARRRQQGRSRAAQDGFQLPRVRLREGGRGSPSRTWPAGDLRRATCTGALSGDAPA